MITVRVVDRSDPPRRVPRAVVVGVYVSSMSHVHLEATTNDEGWFRVERWLDKMIVYAFSKDKKLAGSVNVSGDDAEVTIPVQPVGTAKGQLIDQATGQPAADRMIPGEAPYHYQISNQAGLSIHYLAVSSRTDAEGRFKIANLVPDIEYELSVPLFKVPDPLEVHRYDRLGKVTAKSGETVDLGAVKFRRVMAPGELLDAVLANQTPLDKRLKEMADEGSKRGTRVLVMFWDPTGEPFRRHLAAITDLKPFAGYYFMMDTLGQTWLVAAGYRVISSPVTLKQIEAAKGAYAKKWGSDLFAESWPLFCILDVNGSTLAVKCTREFLKQGKVDDPLLSDFLRKYALKTPDVK